MSSTETETDRMIALAESVAERITKEAAAVRLLQECDGFDLADVRDREGQEGVDSVIAARETLELDALDAEHGEDETGDVAEGVEEWIDRSRFEGALSVSRYGVNHGDGWETTYVQIVLGTGGPHVEVQHHGEAAHVLAYGWFREGETTRAVDPADVDLLYYTGELD